MNNIYTEIDTILDKEHIDLEYEISELADSPVLSLFVLNGTLGTTSENLSNDKIDKIIDKYRFKEILTQFGIDFSIVGYVERDEFFLFSVFVKGETKEMSPKRRATFMELINNNKHGIRVRHVPVLPYVLTLPGAKKSLERGVKFEDVAKYTIKAIVDQTEGLSPMTSRPRKGFVLKSLSTDYSYKVYSENLLMQMGSL